jgi:hypothetical protein
VSTPFIVGIAGPARVGKSTTMRAIETMFLTKSWQIEQRSFANPLYEMIAAMTGLTIEQLKATKDIIWTAETAPIPSLVGWSPRKCLQHVGEFMRKTVSKTIWIERALKPFKWPKMQKQIIVFDDARHDPEYNICQVVIELERDGCRYACDHESAMPPDPEWIDLKVKLDRDPIDIGRELCDFIIERYKSQPPKTNIAAN